MMAWITTMRFGSFMKIGLVVLLLRVLFSGVGCAWIVPYCGFWGTLNLKNCTRNCPHDVSAEYPRMCRRLLDRCAQKGENTHLECSKKPCVWWTFFLEVNNEQVLLVLQIAVCEWWKTDFFWRSTMNRVPLPLSTMDWVLDASVDWLSSYLPEPRDRLKTENMRILQQPYATPSSISFSSA